MTLTKFSKPKKWQAVLLIVLLMHLIFNLVNFKINGICSYFLSLSFYLILGIVSTPKYPKIAILFFTLFLIELGLSQFSPYKSYNERNGNTDFTAPFFNHPEPTPHEAGHVEYDQKPEFDFEHHFNSIGYKDVESNRKSYHAFLLGDSFVQGVGTDENNTIDKHLESMLGCENCILNMGLGGSNLVNHFDLLNQINAAGYSAKYLMLNLNSRDIDDLLFSAHEMHKTDLDIPSLYFQFFYGVSYIFRHFNHDVLDKKWNLLSQEQENKLIAFVYRLITAYILKYDEFCQEQGCKLIVIYQPMANECLDQQFRLNKVILDLNQHHPELVTIDLNHTFDNDCTAYFWPIDGHFNTKGYAKYSQALFKAASMVEPMFCELD